MVVLTPLLATKRNGASKNKEMRLKHKQTHHEILKQVESFLYIKE